MDVRLWRRFALSIVFFRLGLSAPATEPAACARVSAVDSILPQPRDSCSAVESPYVGFGVVEGDEAALQMALNVVYKNREEYVSVLFHASWCPFSKICTPNFHIMSSLFPTVRHFAFEESVIRPSILSRDVTGIKPASLDPTSMGKVIDSSNLPTPPEMSEQENCPFSWARSPEKLLQQDTYLALACSFVLLRLLYFLIPKLNSCIKRASPRISLWDHLHTYLQQAKQGLHRLNPCKKKSNLQEGAKNAKAWASKSLASVSIGDPSSPMARES